MMNRPISVTASARSIKSFASASSENLSAKRRAFFQELLLGERDALLRLAHETTSHLHEFEVTPDPSDRASLEEEHSLELRVRDREREHLHAIDQGLVHIRDGCFGMCEESGESIGLARLMVRPTAAPSLAEQKLRESTRNLRPMRSHA